MDANPPNSCDLRELHLLLNRPSDFSARLCHRLLRAKTALHTFFPYCAASPPPDLRPTAVTAALPDRAAEALVYNHDAGHAARYTIPRAADVGASLSFDYVHSRPDPALYLRRNLVFPSSLRATAAPAAPTSSPAARRAPSSRAPRAIATHLLFGPTMLHQPVADELSAPQRAAHCAAVLQPLALANLHAPVSPVVPAPQHADPATADPLVVVDASSAWFYRLLLRGVSFLLPRGARPELRRGGHVAWNCDALASLHASFAALRLVDTPTQTRLRALLDTTRAAAGAKEGSARGVALLVHGRAATEVLCALRSHIDESVRKHGESGRAVRARLRKFVTVVTLGAAGAGFPAGPAYVHVAAWSDVVARARGPSARRANRNDERRGGGADAVFVRFDTPFQKTARDNHNACALIVPYLALLLRYNDATSLRALWDKGRRKKLRDPRNVTELVAAMIVVTDARRWLWHPDEAMTDVPPQRFPSPERATAMLETAFGEEFVRDVRAAFPDVPRR